jgi:type I restriction enzyme M protein
MNERHKRNLVFDQAWRSCSAFCDVTDPVRCKTYMFSMLFVKYISDIHASRRVVYNAKYSGDAIRVERALRRERFVIPLIEIRDREGRVKESFPAVFKSLYERRGHPGIGELINVFLSHLEEANKVKLHHVFRHIDFNSDAGLGRLQQRNARLKRLIENLNDLDLRSESVGSMDVVEDVFEFLIEKFAATAGKKNGFYTPAAVSETLVRLLAPRPGDRICDPVCGSGSLLIRAGRQVGSDDYALYGQEIKDGTWALCKMNMFLHGLDSARIEREDALRRPRFLDHGNILMKFDVVLADPPFSLDKWGQEMAADDRFNRFYRGIPPKSKGDWAFICHILSILREDGGRAGVVVPHGVLFRGGREGRIRETVIRENLLDSVIGLPGNLFHGTGIPAALMIFDTSRPKGVNGDVLFIDASREFERGIHRNRLRLRDIEMIVNTCRDRRTMDGYSCPASFKEIEANEFSLNIPLYVDTFESGPEVDINAVQQEIDLLQRELADTQDKMNDYLNALGFSRP